MNQKGKGGLSMPITPNYPGVYVEEIPSGVRTIVGVATSITAFVGRARRGPVDVPFVINNYGDFQRTFGGLWEGSRLGYAVRDFFLNGGSQAIIVRVHQGAESRRLSVSLGNDRLQLEAENPGAWANGLEIEAKLVEGSAKQLENLRKSLGLEVSDQLYNLGVTLKDDKRPEREIMRESFRNVIASKPEHPRHLTNVLKNESSLVRGAPGGGVAADSLVLYTALLKQAVDDANQKVEAENLKLPATGAPDWTKIGAALGDVEQKLGELKTELEAVGKQADTIISVELAKLEGDEKLKTLVKDIKAPPVTTDEIAQLSEALDKENQTQKEALDKCILALDVNTVAAGAKELTSTAVQKAQDAKAKAAATSETEAARKSARQGAVDSANKAIQAAASLLPGADLPGTDGNDLAAESFLGGQGAEYQENNKGLYALQKADLFNLLCIPPYTTSQDIDGGLFAPAIKLCEDRRALFIIDPPTSWTTVQRAIAGIDQDVGDSSKNAAVFFPRLRQPDPLRENQKVDFAPCGAVAGVMARTDAERGVWKAPAGQAATMAGVPELSLLLTNKENGQLNPLGINCLRAMGPAGRVIWGARSRLGNDQLASEWKYIPVRRTALFIEESLYRGLQWVVFEPNDEPLWAQIRLNVGAFMHNLFRQGAFQGSTPRDAYFVKCDKETTTQNDINLGIVNIVVGFAPLKPAEFVIIKLQQMAGQIEV
jgi:uncharacterized protein